MKLKILFFPLALAASVVLIIWFIRPELSQVKEERGQLDSQKNILQEITNKKQNISNLSADLDSHLGKEKLVLEFLPFTEIEEEIINALNHSATSSGVALLSLEASVVEDSVLKSAKASVSAKNETSEENIFVRKTKIDLNLTGSYENIRSFLDQVYRMKRADDIFRVGISSQPESENLLAETEIYFDYLPQIFSDSESGLSNPVFSQKSFDFTTADKITELIRSQNVSKLEINSTARSNPFSP